MNVISPRISLSAMVVMANVHGSMVVVVVVLFSDAVMSIVLLLGPRKKAFDHCRVMTAGQLHEILGSVLVVLLPPAYKK